MKKQNIVIIGGVIVLGVAAFWFMKKNMDTITNKVTSAQKALGSALGADPILVSRAGSKDAVLSMRNKASPVPPHSPAVRSSGGATGAEIGQMYQNLAKSRSKSAPPKSAPALTAKGSIQPSPQAIHNLLRTKSQQATSKPISSPVAPKISERRMKQLEANTRSMRAMEGEWSGASKRQRRRRGFY
ncbi:MAG: hypothetical protein ACXADH_05085 [Candidatus Kariarchaeaceae archaeon]|jgi:hypothetical protein